MLTIKSFLLSILGVLREFKANKMYKWYDNNVSKLIVLIKQKMIQLEWSLDIFLLKNVSIFLSLGRKLIIFHEYATKLLE